MNTLGAALMNAELGTDNPMQKLVALAERLGVQFNGSRWQGPHGAFRTLRRLCSQIGIEPPEPLEEEPLLEWEELLSRQESYRRAAAVERVETRFRQASRSSASQAVFDGQTEAVARLVEADLPCTPETVGWAAGLPDVDIIPVEAHVPPRTIRAVEAKVRAETSAALRGASKRHALDGNGQTCGPLMARGVTVTPEAASEILEGLTPEVHRRAAVKRSLKNLWRTQYSKNPFPERMPDETWARIAWLTFMGYALPPVNRDIYFKARAWLADALVDTGLTVSQLCGTLNVARREVIAEALESFARALRVA